MTNRLLITALLASAVALSACNKKESTAGGAADPAKPALPGGPAATVNGKEITAAMLDVYSRSQVGKPASELTAEQKNNALDQLINMEVAAQAAEKDDLDKQTENAARLALLRMDTLANLQVAKHFGEQRPTEAEMRAEYENQVRAMPATEYKASHILVATEEFAQTLIDRIKGGANFADVARKESMDSSKANGGDLSWLPSTTVKEFMTAVSSMKKGEMTQKPVKTEFGYHIIRLDDTRPTTTPEYDQVKERLAQIVQQKKVQAYLKGLRTGMKIEKKL